MRTLAILLLSMGISVPATAAPGKPTSTVAVPPKVKPVSELRIYPATEIPTNPERFIWKLTNVINGVKVSTGPVYVFSFDSIGFSRRIGTLPAGTEIKMDSVRTGSRQHYYAIPFSATQTAGVDRGKPISVGWVPGTHIAVAGYSSTAK